MSNDNENDNAKLVNAAINKYCDQSYDVPAEKTKYISIDIKSKEKVYKLVRLSDKQYYMLRRNCIPIFDDYEQLIILSTNKRLIFSSYAKMYASLRWLFGECGRCYDEWKGSFAYPFLIYIKNGEEEFEYLMNLFNIRSSIEFKLWKLVRSSDERFNSGIFHNPFEDFPREEIYYVNNYFAGFLSGYFESVSEKTCEPFFGTVDSNLIVFGCKDGNYFDDQYEEENQFRKAIKELEKHEIRKIN